jgi:hypothetical protein
VTLSSLRFISEAYSISILFWGVYSDGKEAIGFDLSSSSKLIRLGLEFMMNSEVIRCQFKYMSLIKDLIYYI